MDGKGYGKKCFDASKRLLPYLELDWNIERSVEFFFRAEDFGDFLNSIHRSYVDLHNQMSFLDDDVPVLPYSRTGLQLSKNPATLL